MDTTEKKKNTSRKQPFGRRFIHQGQNVHLFRERLGISQAELAQRINKSQQFVSNLEQQEIIDEETVKQVAQALEIEPQYITDWTTDGSMNIFNVEKMGEGEGSTNMIGTNNFETNHEVYIYPLDKVCELYERMLKEKDEKILLMQSDIDLLKSEVQGLKDHQKK